MMAVKATLDAAGLQCSVVEADTSKQVFSGHRLDHKTGVLSLEATRIWRLRRGLEYAARQRHLTGDKVAKLIGHITWSCLLRRPALSLIRCSVSFCTYLWTPKRTVVACRRARIPMDRVIAATSLLQPYQPLVAVGLCYRCLGWNTWGATESRAACVIQWIRQRQVAVQNGGNFLLKSLSCARRSALGEHDVESAESQLAWSRRHTRNLSCRLASFFGWRHAGEVPRNA